jgi:hypothetical protein
MQNATVTAHKFWIIRDFQTSMYHKEFLYIITAKLQIKWKNSSFWSASGIEINNQKF